MKAKTTVGIGLVLCTLLLLEGQLNLRADCGEPSDTGYPCSEPKSPDCQPTIDEACPGVDEVHCAASTTTEILIAGDDYACDYSSNDCCDQQTYQDECYFNNSYNCVTKPTGSTCSYTPTGPLGNPTTTSTVTNPITQCSDVQTNTPSPAGTLYDADYCD